CDECPVARWCNRTKNGAGATVKPASKRRRQTAVYGLNLRAGRVLLWQRPSNAAQMPGMWELPASQDAKVLFRVRHSITNTDYDVAVVRSDRVPAGARWLAIRKLNGLPLTGLTRKILRQAAIL